MILGIDASNVKSDGGVVHLFELVNNFSFDNSKIKKIIIWGNPNSLKKIKKNKRIYKVQIDHFNSSSFYTILWQLFILPSELKRYNCDVLYVLGGVFFRKKIPTACVFQNILPFINEEIKRYSFFLRLKLLIQKKFILILF